MIAGSTALTIVCSAVLARDVARKIESEVTYPGQIKVTVIRELRASEYAR